MRNDSLRSVDEHARLRTMHRAHNNRPLNEQDLFFKLTRHFALAGQAKERSEGSQIRRTQVSDGELQNAGTTMDLLLARELAC